MFIVKISIFFSKYKPFKTILIVFYLSIFCLNSFFCVYFSFILTIFWFLRILRIHITKKILSHLLLRRQNRTLWKSSWKLHTPIISPKRLFFGAACLTCAVHCSDRAHLVPILSTILIGMGVCGEVLPNLAVVCSSVDLSWNEFEWCIF